MSATWSAAHPLTPADATVSMRSAGFRIVYRYPNGLEASSVRVFGSANGAWSEVVNTLRDMDLPVPQGISNRRKTGRVRAGRMTVSVVAEHG